MLDYFESYKTGDLPYVSRVDFIKILKLNQIEMNDEEID
jgi:hypothetical protein